MRPCDDEFTSGIHSPPGSARRGGEWHWPATAWRHGLARLTSNPINYWAGFATDVIGVALFATLGLRAGGGHVPTAFVVVALGYIGWTLFEYHMHRFLFHAEWSPLAPNHWAHHATPRQTIGLPFFVALAIAMLLFVLCARVMPMPYPYFFVAGAYLGYLSYSALHHLEHVSDLPLPRYRRLRRHHLAHHGAVAANFGVSTTCWDRVFGTWVVQRRVTRDS